MSTKCMYTRHVRIYTGLAGQILTVYNEQFKGMAAAGLFLLNPIRVTSQNLP